MRDRFATQEEKEYLVYAGTCIGPIRHLYLERGMPTEAARRAFTEIRQLCEGPDKRTVAMGLAEVWSLCKRKAEGEEDLTMVIQAFGDRLRDYPSDVVQYVLHQWPNENKFTPSWLELQDKLELFSSRRRRLFLAISEVSGEKPA